MFKNLFGKKSYADTSYINSSRYIKCGKCDYGKIVLREKEYGEPFGGCSNFPNCRNTLNMRAFIFELLKIQGLNIYRFDATCKHCQRNTSLYTYIIPAQVLRYPSNKEGYLSSDAEILGSVIDLDKFMLSKYESVQSVYNSKEKTNKISNLCAHCHSVVNVFDYSYFQKENIFFWEFLYDTRLNNHFIENIPFEQLNMKKEYLSYRNIDDYSSEESIDKKVLKCPSCSGGYLTMKDGKYGIFYGCSNYPKCKKTYSIKTIISRAFSVAFCHQLRRPSRIIQHLTGPQWVIVKRLIVMIAFSLLYVLNVNDNCFCLSINLV